MGKKIKKAKKTKKKVKNSLDYKEHNKKVATKRGKKWRDSLIKAKVGKCPTRIRIVRVRKKISQKDMTGLIKPMCSQTYSRIERGISPASPTHASKIAKKLGSTVTSLFKKRGDNQLIAK